jgi:hypothetical protein
MSPQKSNSGVKRIAGKVRKFHYCGKKSTRTDKVSESAVFCVGIENFDGKKVGKRSVSF